MSASAPETPKPAPAAPATPKEEATKAPPPAEPAAAEAKKTEVDSPAASEFDPIAPELKKGGTLRLAASGENSIQLQGESRVGVETRVLPVRTRETLALGRVLTGQTRPLNLYGLLAPIWEAPNDAMQEAAIIAAVTTVLTTVPHSEEEFITLIIRLAEPVNISTMDRKELEEFYSYLRNPELEDTIFVMVQMVLNERDRLMDLGKALMNMFPQLRGAANKVQEEEAKKESPGQ